MTSRPKRDPTAPLKPVTRGRGDSAPPAPPHELEREGERARGFVHEGRAWIARLAGKAACGTGSYGLALVEAIHFADPAEPDRPLREALIARGDFDAIFDEQLAALLETSRPIAERAS